MTATSRQYLFEQDAAEDERLRAQSGVVDEITRAVFDRIGLPRGGRVLDLGCGPGTVSLLAAEHVGPEGKVVGVDKDAATLERARAETARQGITNIEFHVGDVQTLDGIDDGFDAVVGRIVYLYVPDPVEALRQAWARVRPGGLVCLQEADLVNVWAEPMTPLWQRAQELLRETMSRIGAEPRMGHRLFRTFREAGLPAPELGVRSLVFPATDLPDYTWADIVLGAFPLMEKLGVTTREELGPDTLRERMKAELREQDGIMLVGPVFDACARKPAARDA